MNENERITHPSFGLLRFSRTSIGGKGTELFGSSIIHNETIRMEVKPASIERSLNSDWYGQEGRPFVEVEMSYAQFAEAITSMNMGSGVPVTVRYLNGEEIPGTSLENKRIQFENEVKESMKNLNEKLNDLTAQTKDILENKKTVSKGDRDTILNELAMLQQEIHANMPFIMKMFNEQMDRTVIEAKAEVEAFTQNKLQSLGMERLDELKLLGSTNVKKQDYIE